MRRARVLTLMTALLWAGACGSDGCSESPSADAGDGSVDADADADTDTDADTDSDADTDADADTDTDTDGDAGPEAFSCTAVEPGAASTLADADLTLLGTGFADGMTVALTALDVDGGAADAGSAFDLGAAEVLSPHGAMASAAAGSIPAGSYTVTLTSADSETAVCPDTIDWVSKAPPTVTAVDPATAWDGLASDGIISDQQVAVTGTGFEETPLVTWVDASDPATRFPAAVALFTDATRMEAICPSETEGMPTGMYWVEVVNPDGLGAFWMDGDARGLFEVVGTPPPKIDAIDPFRSPASASPTVTITGQYFQDGAIVELIDVDGVADEMSAAFVDTLTLSATFVAGQGIYAVRVTNPDGQYDVYYSYEATPSSDGHLENFDPVTPTLATARWRHGSSAGYDAFGGAYIYTSGGLDAGDETLGDVEILPVSAFGEPGTPWVAAQWQSASEPRIPNELLTPRHGHALVRAGDWLYAVGGADANTNTSTSPGAALDSVERARILGLETRPEVGSATVGSGSLAAGTWYYQVSALGSWGESLASSRKMVPGGSGSIQISWTPISGATGYNIYRNVDPSGNGGTTRLLATEVTGTSYTDTGASAPAADGTTPLPFGSLSKWQAVAEEMGAAREGVDAVVATVPSGDAAIADKTYLFVVGGRPDATGAGYLASGERAEVLEDGDLGPFADLSHDLNTPRAFYVLITSQGQDENGFTPDPDIPLSKSISDETLYLFAVQGDEENDGSANDGLNDFEVCTIDTADGDNSEWTIQDQTLPGGQTAHGLGALLFFDHLFAFKGVSTEDLGSDPSVGGSAASRVVFYPDAEDPAYVLDTLQSDSTSFVTPRAYYEALRLNGYVWALGGNDGTGPIASIERTLQ